MLLVSFRFDEKLINSAIFKIFYNEFQIIFCCLRILNVLFAFEVHSDKDTL